MVDDPASRLEDENDKLREEVAGLRGIKGLRGWRCPCGGLVFRDTHYDLECGKCQSEMTDDNEFLLDHEIHRLEAKNAKLLKSLKKYGKHGVPCPWHTKYAANVCTCGLEAAIKGDATDGNSKSKS